MGRVVSMMPYSEFFADVHCEEFLHVVEMPIRMHRAGQILLPPHLRCFKKIAQEVQCFAFEFKYLYLTAKHGFVSPDIMGNRPGWHIDGYGTDDLNFIWFDTVPTEMCEGEFDLSDDHTECMLQLENEATHKLVHQLPKKHIIHLDNTVVHRVGKTHKVELRTFVKITASNNKHQLRGNAHNYCFDYDWQMRDRSTVRNDP